MSVAGNGGAIKKESKAMWLMLIIAVISTFLDQFTKVLVRRAISTGGTIRVIEGWFHLIYAKNSGMAFGMLPGWNHVLTFVSTFAIVFIFMYYRQLKPTRWMKISLGMVMGGVLGNLVDRVVYGYVTDFIQVRWWFIHYRWWPSFNIADVCICAGAAMLIMGIFGRSRSMDLSEQSKATSSSAPEDPRLFQSGN